MNISSSRQIRLLFSFWVIGFLVLSAPAMADSETVRRMFPEIYHAAFEEFSLQGLPSLGVPTPLEYIKQNDPDYYEAIRFSVSTSYLFGVLLKTNDEFRKRYKAAQIAVGTKSCERFFEHFTEHEVDSLRLSFYRNLFVLQRFYFRQNGINFDEDIELTERLIETAKSRVISRKTNIQNNVRGDLGESFGNAYLRILAQDHGVISMDEFNYKRFNEFGPTSRNLLDGLVYSLHDGKLYIHIIHEAKMTTRSELDYNQAYGYLSKWKRSGNGFGLVVLDQNGNPLKFYGDGIYFLPLEEKGEWDQAVSINELMSKTKKPVGTAVPDSFQAEEFYLLTSAKPNTRFRGRNLVPISHAMATNIGIRMSKKAMAYCQDEVDRIKYDNRRRRRARIRESREQARKEGEEQARSELFKRFQKYKNQRVQRENHSIGWKISRGIRKLRRYLSTLIGISPHKEVDEDFVDLAKRQKRDAELNKTADRDRNAWIEKKIKKRQQRRDYGTLPEQKTNNATAVTSPTQLKATKPKKPAPLRVEKKPKPIVAELTRDDLVFHLKHWMIDPLNLSWPKRNPENEMEMKIKVSLNQQGQGQADYFIHLLDADTHQAIVHQELSGKGDYRKAPAMFPLKSKLLKVDPFKVSGAESALKAYIVLYESRKDPENYSVQSSPIVLELRRTSERWNQLFKYLEIEWGGLEPLREYSTQEQNLCVMALRAYALESRRSFDDSNFPIQKETGS